MDMVTQLDSVLNSAASGLELARQVLAAIERNGSVHLDFAPVDRITPSFANAFVMTLLERYPVEVLRNKLRMDNRKPAILQAITESVLRYQNGIRLSTQLDQSGCGHVYA